MIAITAMAIPRFLDFPAVSLPRLRFDRKIAVKLLIRADFWCSGEPRENFSPEFPGAAGNGRGRYPALFRPFGAASATGSAVAVSFFLRPPDTGSSSGAWRRSGPALGRAALVAAACFGSAAASD